MNNEAVPAVPRVGVYIDGFNLWYGMCYQGGKGKAGWRWLDVAALAQSLINPQRWPAGQITRVVHCTAERTRHDDPSSLEDQRTYLAALQAFNPAVEVVFGLFAARTKRGALAEQRRGKDAVRVQAPPPEDVPDWLPAKRCPGPEGGDELRVTIATFEEKGSDVNVATTLLVDVLTGQIDAAIVISNDSDLALPLQVARRYVPVGTVNPSSRWTAAGLQGVDTDGAGRHWWKRLKLADLYAHQLPDPAAGHTKPPGW